MSLLLLLRGGTDTVVIIDSPGVYLPAHNATLILELSTADAFAAEQVWLDASEYLINRAGSLEGNVVVDHGRDSETDRFRESTLKVLLDNTAGTFDRRNVDSDFYEALRSLRQVRLFAHRGEPGAPDGPVEVLFRGFIRGFPRRYGMVHQFSWVDLSCFNGFRLLSQAGMDDAGFTLDDDDLGLLDVGRLAGDDEEVQLSGERVEALADIAGWPEDLRSIDPGLVLVGPGDGDSPLEAMQEAEEAEAGYLFIDKAGILTYLPRLAPWELERMTEVQATFGGSGLAIFDVNGIGPDSTRIRNDVARTGLSGVEQSAEDADSILHYTRLPDGPRDLIAVNDGDVAGSVATLLHSQAEEVERLDELTIEATVDPDTLYAELLERQVLDRVEVELTEPYGASDTAEWLVQRIRLSITASSFRGVYRLSPTTDLTLFTFDDDDLGLLDGDAVLAP